MPNRLRSCADRLHRGRVCRETVGGDEKVVIVHVAIHAPGNFRGLGPEGRTSAFEEYDHHDAAHAGIRVRGEPTEAGSIVRTGSGLAQNFFFAEVEAQAAGSPVLHGSGHAVRELRDQRSDVKLTLDARLEAGYFFGSGG